MFGRNKTKIIIKTPKPRIIVNTDYDSFEIVNLKSVWINYYFGTCRLMYQDDIYEYNCIYWSNTDSKDYFLSLKKKLLDAYNRGDRIVEL